MVQQADHTTFQKPEFIFHRLTIEGKRLAGQGTSGESKSSFSEIRGKRRVLPMNTGLEVDKSGLQSRPFHVLTHLLQTPSRSMNFLGFDLPGSVFLAPMAGVTDLPFRRLCKTMGAAYAVSEMVSANALVYGNAKTRRRLDQTGETGVVAVQIAGSDPEQMAKAARLNVDEGAAIIDINMGCPAKKVCNVMAGSALMRDEDRVARILEAVVAAVPETPVTLKTRTGWDESQRNVLRILKIAENAGIQAITVHGRTRDQQYRGKAEYETIRAVKAEAGIPVIANGDIDSPEKARAVLEFTGADAVMVGRAAQGNPWIFREMAHYLATGDVLPPVSWADRGAVLMQHLDSMYSFYGEYSGVRMARKHIAWYTVGLPASGAFRQAMYQETSSVAQQAAVQAYFLTLSCLQISNTIAANDEGYVGKECVA